MPELIVEQASLRSQSFGPRPKTCPVAFTKTPQIPTTILKAIHSTIPCIFRTFPRTPLPSTIDPITKEVNYGDPNHRQCIPTYRPASAYLPRDNHFKYNNKTHTSMKTIRYTSGMIWAIPHRLTPMENRHSGAYLKFDDLTSKNYFEKKVRKFGEEMDSLTKKLCRYSPSANRNLKNEVTRTPVGIHSRDCRNASYLNLVSGKHGYFKTPKTTNQSFLKRLRNPTGFNNSVIFAAKSKLYHRLQRRFD